MACSAETARVSLEDCTCPICMCILIEPVIMPCHHELCRPCFKQNVEEASLLCPMCRTRIGTWARLATKTKTLVNVERWEQIQKLFPKRVRLRLEGKDEEDDSCDVRFHPHIHLAEPGEIRKEYEDELKRLRQQLLQERRKEEIESKALIQKLQEEEERERAKQNVQQDEINQNDEILARELDKVINEAGTDDPIDLLMEESKSRLTRSNSVASNQSSQSNSGPLDTFFNKYKAQTETTRQTSPYPYPCISPSEKEKAKDNSRSNSSVGKRSNSSAKTEIYPINLADHTYCPHPNAPKSSTVARPPSDEIFAISDSSSEAVKETQETAKERSESVGSNDSISNELCHFKPIVSCPRTPPRKMADGKIVDPPVVRTTPRNLSRNGFGSPVDNVTSPGLEPGSPIMQKRLSELALERQLLVQERSKSTSTGPDDKHHSNNTYRHKAHNARESTHPVENLSRPPLHTVSESPTDDDDHHHHTGGLGCKSGLLIPLEPLIEEHDHRDYDDITPVLLNLRQPSTSHAAEHKDDPEPSTSRSPLQVKSPSLEKARRSQHNSKEQKAQTSNQRSIKDWFKTEDKSRDNSADLFEEKNDVAEEGLDTNENSPLHSEKGQSPCNVKDLGGGDGANIHESDIESECEESNRVDHKRKKKHKIRCRGDGLVQIKAHKKSNPKENSREAVKKKKLYTEKCSSVSENENLSDNGVDSGKTGRNGLGKKKKVSRKKNKHEEIEENKLGSDEEQEMGQHKKFVQQVDPEIAFLSESELSLSEPETESSSPVRKSNRKRRRKGESDEDFEFVVDTLNMSDAESEASHRGARRKGRKAGKKEEEQLHAGSGHSEGEDDDFVVRKKQRIKKKKQDPSSSKCDMSEADESEGEIEKLQGQQRGEKCVRRILSDESEVEDSEHVENSAKKTKVSRPKHKQGKSVGRKGETAFVSEVDAVSEAKHIEATASTISSSKRKKGRRRNMKDKDKDFDPSENEFKSDSSGDEAKKTKKTVASSPRRTRVRGRKNKDEDFNPDEEEVKACCSEDEDTPKSKTSRQRRKRAKGRNKKDKELDAAEENANSSDAEENPSSKKQLRQKKKKTVKVENKLDESEHTEPEKPKAQRQKRKRNAVKTDEVKDTDKSNVDEDEAVKVGVPKSPRRARSRKHEKISEEEELKVCEEAKSEEKAEVADVKKEKSKKPSPKKQSPKKASPRKTTSKKSSPKKPECSESESSSPCKRQKTKPKPKVETTLLGKRSHLLRCATEELLEENVDPNTNRNNSSSSLPSPSKRGRKNRNENSDADNLDVTPRKRHRTVVTETDDDAFESPSKSEIKPTLSKKRSESVSVKAFKPKTPVQRKGRRRHTTGDQQSIVQYLSGAGDTDTRQDIDEEVESDATEGCSQEDEDRKMALKLQRQFNLEQRFSIAAERFKGGAEQYQFRRKPKYVD